MSVKSNDIKMVRKIFFAWEDEKEAQWLTEMSQSGWHLQSISGLTKYIFTKGEPKNMVYQLDFTHSISLDEEYLQLFKDSGWAYLGNFFNWQYFVKEYEANGVNEIFTEPDDKIRRNRKILMLFIPLILLNSFFGFLNLRSIIFSDNIFQFSFIPFSNLICAIILIFGMIKIINRNSRLKKQHL